MAKPAEDDGVKRLKREHCLYVKHDKIFSKWKVLIGPSDWEDHQQGKEGIERYRIHNLPSSAGPGIYELGITVYPSKAKTRKIKRKNVIVVYLGKAENIRSRLQSYGRSGSHLEGHTSCFLDEKANVLSNKPRGTSKDVQLQQGPGLFRDVFSRGYAIVYRWASMPTKWQAEKCEAQLLKVFDYAWNKDSNVTRRPQDAILKLEKVTSHTFFTSLQNLFLQRKWIIIRKEAGIRIVGQKPTEEGKREDEDPVPIPGCGACLCNRNRSPPVSPKNLQQKSAIRTQDAGKPKTDSKKICGALKNDGTICHATPPKNRKRCAKHKGRSISNRARISTESDQLKETVEEPINTKPCCGAYLDDGSVCKIIPDKGRKRCNIHKGMRISSDRGTVAVSKNHAFTTDAGAA